MSRIMFTFSKDSVDVSRAYRMSEVSEENLTLNFGAQGASSLLEEVATLRGICGCQEEQADVSIVG